MIKKKFLKVIILLLTCIFIVSCGDGESDDSSADNNADAPKNIPVTSVHLNKQTTRIDVGKTEQLLATIAPSNATNQNVTWKSSNEAKANVSESGLVTAVAVGKATITVTSVDGNYTAECVVTVDYAVTGISLNKTTTSIDVDTTEQFLATIAPSNATNQNVIWKSSDESIVTVSDSGLVTAVEIGKTTITVATVDGNYTSQCDVTVTSDQFITKWKTNNTGQTSLTDVYQIKLPLDSDGIYDFTVYWGDGTSNTITAHDDPNLIHTYSKQGTYTVKIDGTIEGFGFKEKNADNNEDYKKLIDIINWGNVKLHNKGYQLTMIDLIEFSAYDSPNLENITNLSNMFFFAFNFNGDLNSWDVSNVTNMSGMFSSSSFNQDISGWDVSNVTDMSEMFSYSDFNQNINGWNVIKVTNMSQMFASSEFNMDISDWIVSSVTDMSGMFSGSDFNQNINGWDVSKVTDMSEMFYGNRSFNQNLNGWIVSSVTNMSKIFLVADSFNQNISDWDVSKVTNMSQMFSHTSFNQYIGGWDVSSVKDMSNMFTYNTEFNQYIGDWTVGSVTNMFNMFSEASSFNQNISDWDVSGVTNSSNVFYRCPIEEAYKPTFN
ncbi:MAG: BspA family leucine-rich repeat surface protein [Desulfobacterales bacterium]|nr:BspA family leucine-rich repeat surface protein [Desulfobacterales bacterium]